MEPQNPGKEEVSKNVKDLDDWLPITINMQSGVVIDPYIPYNNGKH